MKAVIQRVLEASVTVDGRLVSRIERGYLVLLGVRCGDGDGEALWLARKTAGLRVFEDADGRMSLGLDDVGGQVLAVSQFTLYADCRKGNRPGFTGAAPAQVAQALYERYVAELRRILGPDRVGTGIFQTHMEVRLLNDGPVTIVLETPDDGVGK